MSRILVSMEIVVLRRQLDVLSSVCGNKYPACHVLGCVFMSNALPLFVVLKSFQFVSMGSTTVESWWISKVYKSLS